MRIDRHPDEVLLVTDHNTVKMRPWSEGEWHAGDVSVRTLLDDGRIPVFVTSGGSAVRHVQMVWKAEVPFNSRVLGDRLERNYGDMGWRSPANAGDMWWYFLTNNHTGTTGIGVETGANGLCSWRLGATDVSLGIDVRNGAMGVRLLGRILHAATVISRHYGPEMSAWEAGRRFCTAMCPAPRMPKHVVYGGNNWYYAYGRSNEAQILGDSELISRLSPNTANRPFMTIDAGWQTGAEDDCNIGDWFTGNRKFPSIETMPDRMKILGVRPGVWTRSLVASATAHESLLLPDERAASPIARRPVYDPSIPEVLAKVRGDIARMREWGFELIKNDFSTVDLLGRWGHSMERRTTNDGWHFADRSRTTAEIVKDLYSAMRAGAGDGVIIGCNTIGHLSAGVFELQRTGDDTSGHNWNRTKLMGVNSLAFRSIQHGAFFATDADCFGMEGHKIPFAKNERWLDVLSRSGTPLFVSLDPTVMDATKESVFRAALERASVPTPPSEPLDWMTQRMPAQWRTADGAVHGYHWGQVHEVGHSALLPDMT